MPDMLGKKDDGTLVIDLHADEVLETTAGMNSADILHYQMDIFKKTMEEYKDLEDIMKLRQKYINCLNGISEAKDIIMNDIFKRMFLTVPFIKFFCMQPANCFCLFHMTTLYK